MSGKKISQINISDLFKRVPASQMAQFEIFRDLTLSYHRQANKYPAKLPPIDWEYYRNNVRPEVVQMVEQFQIKYEELDNAFGARFDVLDYTKYYAELEALTAKVKEEVKDFAASSNKRINEYEQEIKRLRDLIPYDSMTLEEFVTLREEVSGLIPRQGKPIFWPPLESDQRVGPADPEFLEHDEHDVKT